MTHAVVVIEFEVEEDAAPADVMAHLVEPIQSRLREGVAGVTPREIHIGINEVADDVVKVFKDLHT